MSSPPRPWLATLGHVAADATAAGSLRSAAIHALARIGELELADSQLGAARREVAGLSACVTELLAALEGENSELADHFRSQYRPTTVVHVPECCPDCRAGLPAHPRGTSCPCHPAAAGWPYGRPLPIVVSGVECPTCHHEVYEDGARWRWRCPECLRDGEVPARTPQP